MEFRDQMSARTALERGGRRRSHGLDLWSIGGNPSGTGFTLPTHLPRPALGERRSELFRRWQRGPPWGVAPYSTSGSDERFNHRVTQDGPQP